MKDLLIFSFIFIFIQWTFCLSLLLSKGIEKRRQLIYFIPFYYILPLIKTITKAFVEVWKNKD